MLHLPPFHFSGDVAVKEKRPRMSKKAPITSGAEEGVSSENGHFLNGRSAQWLAVCQRLTSGDRKLPLSSHTPLPGGITILPSSRPRVRLKRQLFSGEMMCVMMKWGSVDKVRLRLGRKKTRGGERERAGGAPGVWCLVKNVRDQKEQQMHCTPLNPA